MTCYLLDTNILIAAANDTSAILNSYLAKHTNGELFTSSLSWMEIYHGILRISPEGVMTHKARMYLKVFENLSHRFRSNLSPRKTPKPLLSFTITLADLAVCCHFKTH